MLGQLCNMATLILNLKFGRFYDTGLVKSRLRIILDLFFRSDLKWYPFWRYYLRTSEPRTWNCILVYISVLYWAWLSPSLTSLHPLKMTYLSTISASYFLLATLLLSQSLLNSLEPLHGWYLTLQRVEVLNNSVCQILNLIWTLFCQLLPIQHQVWPHFDENPYSNQLKSWPMNPYLVTPFPSLHLPPSSLSRHLRTQHSFCWITSCLPPVWTSCVLVEMLEGFDILQSCLSEVSRVLLK